MKNQTPPTTMRIFAMAKKLHIEINKTNDYDPHYISEIIVSVQKLEEPYRKLFIEKFNSLGGKIKLK